MSVRCRVYVCAITSFGSGLGASGLVRGRQREEGYDDDDDGKGVWMCFAFRRADRREWEPGQNLFLGHMDMCVCPR